MKTHCQIAHNSELVKFKMVCLESFKSACMRIQFQILIKVGIGSDTPPPPPRWDKIPTLTEIGTNFSAQSDEGGGRDHRGFYPVWRRRRGRERSGRSPRYPLHIYCEGGRDGGLGSHQLWVGASERDGHQDLHFFTDGLGRKGKLSKHIYINCIL